MPLSLLLPLLGIAAWGWYEDETDQLKKADDLYKSFGGANVRDENRIRKENARQVRDRCIMRRGAAMVLMALFLVLSLATLCFEWHVGEKIVLLP